MLGIPGLEPGNMGTLQLLVKQFLMSLLLHESFESLKQGDFSVLDENLLVRNDLPELTQQDRGGARFKPSLGSPWSTISLRSSPEVRNLFCHRGVRVGQKGVSVMGGLSLGSPGPETGPTRPPFLKHLERLSWDPYLW